MQENIAVISLKNIVHNFSVFRRLAGGAKVCAVVKADAYGHGAERVAESLEGYADGFAVTSVKEGIALRIAGIRKPIWSSRRPWRRTTCFSPWRTGSRSPSVLSLPCASLRTGRRSAGKSPPCMSRSIGHEPPGTERRATCPSVCGNCQAAERAGPGGIFPPLCSLRRGGRRRAARPLWR